MTTETSKATDEAEIRGLVEGWAAAIRAKDADGVVSHTSPESVGFFLVGFRVATVATPPPGG